MYVLIDNNYRYWLVKSKKFLKYRKKDTGNKFIGIVFVGVIIAVSAFAVWMFSAQGDENTSGIDLPSYAYRTNAITQSYMGSVMQQTLFEYIPCYCGCADMDHLAYNHRHLRDCFYDDSGEFTQHAAGCNTCIDIGTTIYSMYKEGSSLLEMRNAIDTKYAVGNYPPPTPTPMPPA